MKTNKINYPAGIFAQLYKRENIIDVLENLPDEVLLRDMHQSAETENYEMAVLYRDELIRRGILKPLG